MVKKFLAFILISGFTIVGKASAIVTPEKPKPNEIQVIEDWLYKMRFGPREIKEKDIQRVYIDCQDDDGFLVDDGELCVVGGDETLTIGHCHEGTCN